jgi:hypothetical protein
MKLRFGLEWDGIEPATPLCELDCMTCGPMGLLGVLETRLGLKAKPVSQATRILQFRALLENIAPRRDVFYRRSFDKDPIAVAQTLLQWRDQLVEAGWNGAALDSDSPRIRDMGAIEANFAGNVGAGIPDRLAGVLQELESRSARIDSLVVLNKREHLPTLWQRLCDKLDGEYRPTQSAADESEGESDLALVRAALCGASAGPDKRFRLRNDGSVLCLTAYSEAVLARGVAQWLRKSRAHGLTLLIAGHDSDVLDRALAALDEPATGIQPRSSARRCCSWRCGCYGNHSTRARSWSFSLTRFVLCLEPFDAASPMRLQTVPALPVPDGLRRFRRPKRASAKDSPSRRRAPLFNGLTRT